MFAVARWQRASNFPSQYFVGSSCATRRNHKFSRKPYWAQSSSESVPPGKSLIQIQLELHRVVVGLHLNREWDSRLDGWRLGVRKVEDRAEEIGANVIGNRGGLPYEAEAWEKILS
jgi:hypothetical protein